MLFWSKNIARTPLLLLALAEASILYVSVYFACSIVFGDIESGQQALGSIAPRAGALSAVMLVSMIAMGLYQFHQRVFFHEVMIRVIVGVAIGSLVLAAIYPFLPGVNLEPKVAALAVLSALVFLLVLRFYFLRNIDFNIFRRRTLIYGAGDRAAAITDLKRRADRRGFQVVGTIAAPGDTVSELRIDLMDTDRTLVDVAREHDAEEIVVAMDDRRGNLPIRELLDCKLRGINVIDLVEFLERETGKIHIDLVNPGWLIFSPGFRVTRFRRIVKRILDFVVGFAVLIVTSPLMLMVAVAIKIEDGLLAPVIFRQRRVGHHGDVFNILKFRSMHVDAEADGKAVWADKHDKRVTRVGAIIRRVRLDELPQIVNVFLGQMSLVGPRPERPEFVDDLAKVIPYYSERHTVKPGVTGWAQLRHSYGSSVEDAEEKLRYDLYYVKNHNLLLDLTIILQTVEVILWGKGAR